MAIGPRIEDTGGPIARLFGEGSASGMDEGELLRRFASNRDPVAFEVLVARHGPMVLGVCRRLLGNRHSSEDAFQATFLVLSRKAGSIRDPDRLGPWLHSVAHRVAVRARADLARRNARERSGAEDLAMETSADDPGFDRLELRAALDEEVRRLPEKFREPIVLCYLDGLTHDEAASRLRCPVGTVRSRLSTGRAKLRERLSRRGVVVPSGVFAAVLTAEGALAAVSPVLLSSTVKAATAFAGGMAAATAAGMVSAGVASLAEGVSKSMILTKLKIVGGLALAGMMTLGVGGVAAYQVGGPGQEEKAEKPEKPADEAPDFLIVKLKAQVAQQEDLLKRVQAELNADRARLADAQARLRALRPTKDATAQKEPTEGFFDVPAKTPAPKEPAVPQRPKLAKAATGGMGADMGGIGGGASGGVAAPGTRLGKPATYQGNDFVIVRELNGNKLVTYSTETGRWTAYETKGVELVPIASAGVVALLVRGDEIGHTATFVPKTGLWYPINLKEPAHGEVSPIVGATQAAYAIGRRVYAFSVPTLSWDVLELPEGAKPAPVMFNNRTTVEHGDNLYMFSVKTGKWTDFDAKASQPAVPESK